MDGSKVGGSKVGGGEGQGQGQRAGMGSRDSMDSRFGVSVGGARCAAWMGESCKLLAMPESGTRERSMG